MIGLVLNWLFVEILIPIYTELKDSLELSKAKKDCEDSIEVLKNAKDKSAIDSAIDKLP